MPKAETAVEVNIVAPFRLPIDMNQVSPPFYSHIGHLNEWGMRNFKNGIIPKGTYRIVRTKTHLQKATFAIYKLQ